MSNDLKFSRVGKYLDILLLIIVCNCKNFKKNFHVNLNTGLHTSE